MQTTKEYFPSLYLYYSHNSAASKQENYQVTPIHKSAPIYCKIKPVIHENEKPLLQNWVV